VAVQRQTDPLHVMLGRTFVSPHDNHSPKRVLHVTDVVERAVSAQVKRLDQGTLSVRQNQPPVKSHATPGLHRHMQDAHLHDDVIGLGDPNRFPIANGSSEEEDYIDGSLSPLLPLLDERMEAVLPPLSQPDRSRAVLN
jgi:hypothetical protein